MLACPTCAGFVPDHLAACPHCDAAPKGWRRLARAVLALAGGLGFTVTMAACYGAPGVYDTCPDQDGDGWLPGCYNDDLSCDPDDPSCDCDDGDLYTHPGALDPVGDGLDRDCDGKDGQAPGGPYPDAAVVTDAGIYVDATQDDAAPEPDAAP